MNLLQSSRLEHKFGNLHQGISVSAALNKRPVSIDPPVLKFA